jgi:DoxX-like family
MSILQISIVSAIAWLLAIAFIGAGVYNAVGGAVVQAQFLRWGYPAWWNFITAALETLSAVLIVLPETRIWGLALGAIVLIAAVSTVTWHREYQHLPPGVVLAALTGIELALVLRGG